MTFHLLAKPTGSQCNLDCAYCFFLSKASLYPGSSFRMTEELLETYLRQLIEAQSGPEIQVAWQGGEPTLMGLEFFERSVELAERLKRPGQSISYTFQTNGVLLNRGWAEFFKRNRFLIGLSMDGPQQFHDAYRVNRGGAGTFGQVLRSFRLLQTHEVDTNILCAVHAANGDFPLEVYRFFRDDLGARYLQFIPIVERAPSGADASVTERSIKPDQFGRFLVTVFDEWVRHDVGEVFVQYFDGALANWLGQPSLCIFQPACGRSLVLEHNGDVYACDHYVGPEHRLGNIERDKLRDLVDSEKQEAFGFAKYDRLPDECRNCDVLFACYGECPRNRFVASADSDRPRNYLCAGYKEFFRHIDEPMRIMTALLRQGRYADETMGILADQQASERLTD
ncbi:MAG TPA: anaerobic sulfatase maturase [Sphingomicrobium sp.]|nr:anaerobic sulfatase maturase [Sphingomicrobium sp.]